MYLQLLASAVESSVTFTEAITPYIAPAFLLFGVIATAWIGAHNRRKGATENRAPDVNEIWVRSEEDHRRLDAERSARRRLEDLLDLAIRVFKNYVNRVKAGGSVELTTTELKVYSMELPVTDEK